MESVSNLFFAVFYVFSFVSICLWVYLVYAHNGAGAYVLLSGYRKAFSFDRDISSAVRKFFQIFSALVCFIIFLCALCNGFLHYFSWIPDHLHLTLGDGSPLHLSTILSCLVGICSSIVFGLWVFKGVSLHWKNRVIEEQSDLYFDIIRHADNIEELSTLKEIIHTRVQRQKDECAVTRGDHLEMCARVIDLRIEDIRKNS